MRNQDFLIEFHWETGSEVPFDLKGYWDEIKGDVSIKGTYGFIDEEKISLEGVLSFKAICACDLCLTEFEESFQIPFSETYYPWGSEEGFNYQGNKLDLSPLVADMAAITLGEKRLCKESCKGLCEICGEDLNIRDCGCQKKTVNPKFQKLEQLLKDQL